MWAQLSSFHHVFACTHRGKLQGSSCLGNRRTKGFWRDWDHPSILPVLTPVRSFFSFCLSPVILIGICFQAKLISVLLCPLCRRAQDDPARIYKEANQLPDIRCLSTKQEDVLLQRHTVFFRNVSAGLFPFLGREKLICWGWMITPQPLSEALGNSCCVLLSTSSLGCAVQLGDTLCDKLVPLGRALLHLKSAFTEHEGFLLCPATHLPTLIHPAD